MTRFNFLFALLLLFSFSCKEKPTTPVKKKNTTVKKVKRQKPKPAPKKRTAKLSKKEILEARKIYPYHIVAASYKNRQTAVSFQKQLYRRGYPSTILEDDGKFRVILQSFMSKDLAQSELNRMRQLNRKKDLWLLHDQQ